MPSNSAEFRNGRQAFRHLPAHDIGTEPSAVAPGQIQANRPVREFDPALLRSVLCLTGIGAPLRPGICEMPGGSIESHFHVEDI